MDQAIGLFLDHLRFEKGCSPRTLRAYRENLNGALAFLREQNGASLTEPGQVTTGHVRGYVVAMARSGKSARTIRQRVSTLSSFFSYLVARDQAEINPTDGVVLPRAPRTLPHVIRPQDMLRLLDTPRSTTLRGLRDRALLQVAYSGALRVSELVGLDLEDLDLDAGEALIRGKGRRERKTLLGPPSVAAVRAWLPERQRYLEETARLRQGFEQAALFTNVMRSHSVRGDRLTSRRALAVVKCHASAAGLDAEAIGTHTLRHSAATHLLDNGANIRAIQKLLGHSSVSSTQLYTQVSVEKMRTVFNNTHPRAQPRGPGQGDKR